jgi:hypothetical protein
MKKLKDILKRKMGFIHYNANSDNYLQIETEFIDFVFETQELAEIVRKIILKNKVDRYWLECIFDSYMLCHPKISFDDGKIEISEFSMPAFWSKELEKEMGLFKSFRELLDHEHENIKNKSADLSEATTERNLRSYYNTENLYNIKKLYADILQEIDLTELRKKEPSLNTSSAIEGFNEAMGILKFSGQEIEISKKGKETDAVLLLKTLLAEKTEEWKHNDEILTDWGYNSEDLKALPKNKIYFASKNINNSVAIKTKIGDFIEFNTYKARINPKYRTT